jgi:hypothetical protein
MRQFKIETVQLVIEKYDYRVIHENAKKRRNSLEFLPFSPTSHNLLLIDLFQVSSIIGSSPRCPSAL